jgi:hypothetical protein
VVTPAADHQSLAELLGGRRGAIDASLPPIAFVAGWLVAGGTEAAVGPAAAAAVSTGALVAGWRVYRRTRPGAALAGLLGVLVAALIALRTGRAADFFLLQLVSNSASALVWTLSIVVRGPLLGVGVGLVLGQRARGRRDPALLRAYSRGSWVWVCQYLLRVAVFVPLWLAGNVVGLGVARAALSWPLVAACLVASWWVVRRALPPGHAGLRHPPDGW